MTEHMNNIRGDVRTAHPLLLALTLLVRTAHPTARIIFSNYLRNIVVFYHR